MNIPGNTAVNTSAGNPHFGSDMTPPAPQGSEQKFNEFSGLTKSTSHEYGPKGNEGNNNIGAKETDGSRGATGVEGERGEFGSSPQGSEKEREVMGMLSQILDILENIMGGEEATAYTGSEESVVGDTGSEDPFGLLGDDTGITDSASTPTPTSSAPAGDNNELMMMIQEMFQMIMAYMQQQNTAGAQPEQPTQPTQLAQPTQSASASSQDVTPTANQAIDPLAAMFGG